MIETLNYSVQDPYMVVAVYLFFVGIMTINAIRE